MKTCGGCKQTFPLTEFYRHKRNKDGYNTRCKICDDQSNKKYKEDYPGRAQETYRRSALRIKYGMTPEQYNELLEKQNHCCALCGKHKDDEKKNLSVDHNHITREIRGLLCTNCNYRLVGRHRDGDLLRRIADYIEQGTGWFVPKKKRPVKRKPK